MAKNFVVRLRCPHGDEDQVLVLQNREETLGQILGMRWEFDCPAHGAQRQIPVEASEKQLFSSSTAQRSEPAEAICEVPKPRSSIRISLHVPVMVYGWSKGEASFHEETTTLLVNASGGLVTLASKVGLGDTVFVVNARTQREQECRVAYTGEDFGGKIRVGVAFKHQDPNFWGKNRKELRTSKSLRVWVRGVDRDGQKFAQSALTVDVSQHGARLDGIGYLTEPGETVEVRRRWRKARFRVVWVGEIGREQAGQAGLFCLEPGKNIWEIRQP